MDLTVRLIFGLVMAGIVHFFIISKFGNSVKKVMLIPINWMLYVIWLYANVVNGYGIESILSLVFFFVMMVIGFVTAILIPGQALKSVNKLCDEAEKIMTNDVNAKITEIKFVEYRRLFAFVDLNINRVKVFSTRISELIKGLDKASKDITEGIDQQAAALIQQSSSLNETTTTVQELGATSEQSTEKAEGVVSAAEAAMKNAEDARKAVSNSIDDMEDIRASVKDIKQEIDTMFEQSRQISSIVGTVTAIAKKTNLIALNASIEASKAGESGKGFAVVATEVRQLAVQSQNAVGEIAQIVQNLQEAASDVAEATNKGTHSVDKGSQSVNSSGELMEESMVSMEENVAYAQQILAASRQQSVGIEQITLALANVNDVIQHISETAQNNKPIAQELTEFAKELDLVVNRETK